ncbi:MAG: tetratricopeptide repeat protein [Brevinema sp.]
MKILFFFIFFLGIPFVGYSETFINQAFAIKQLLHQEERNHFLSLFEQGRFSLLNTELSMYFKTQQNPIREELQWLKGHSLYQINHLSEAKSQLIPLSESTNILIKQRAFLDLANIAITNNDLVNAEFYLKQIITNNTNTSFKEIAQAKLIVFYLSDPKKSLGKHTEISKLMSNFETSYPNSPYRQELHYLYALYQFNHFHPTAAKEYVVKILEHNTNDKVQRLIAEIELSEQNYQEAQKYFLPLADKINRFQDEALYKSALIYKLNQDFTNAHRLLTKLINYHRNSRYIDRAKAELATVDITLKNYDNALKYYLFESGFTGTRKALALLKIAEVYYIKGDTTSTRRTANRIQREFPYSSYANEALYWLGKSYMADKEFKKSIQNFDEYLIREPQSQKNEEIAIFLGHSYANLNDLSKARSYFQQIIRYSKNDQLKRNALLGLGRTYSKDEPVRSLEYYDQVWQKWPKAPESAQALYFAGATRYNLREHKKAMDNFSTFTNTFSTSPLYPDSVLALAKLSFKAENFQNILDLSSIKTDNKEILSEFKELHARSFFRTKEYAKALPLFQEAGELTKNKERKTELFLAEGSTLRNLERHKEAIKQYEKYLSSMKKSTQTNLQELIWNEIISSYIEIKELDKASAILETLKEQFSNGMIFVDLHSKIGDSYFTDKKFDQAIYHYQQIPIYSKNKDVIMDASFRETWGYVEAQKPETIIKLQNFLDTYPSHHSIPSVMYKLSELKKDDQLKYIILAKYPYSSEAEIIRNYLEKKYSPHSSIEELDIAIRNTSDLSLRSRYLLMLGTKFENEEKWDEALQIFLDTHKLTDSVTGPQSAFKAASIYNKQNKYKKSLRLYINIISQYDEKYTPKALDNIIMTYAILNDSENVQKFIDRLTTQYPNSNEAKKWI